LVHATGWLHWPAALHVSTPFDWHCTLMATQTPVQTPLTHVAFVQAIAEPHMPVAPQVSTPLPEHVVLPGLHVPVHSAPPPASATVEHTPVHGEAVPQIPAGVQVWTPLPLHSVWFGEHTPTHMPPLHVWLEQATGEDQVPVLSHVSTPLPTHCTAPGEHATQPAPEHAVPASPHTLKQTALASPHVDWFCHSPTSSPVVPHVCTFAPEHCFWPGAQTPTHACWKQVWLWQHWLPQATPPASQTVLASIPASSPASGAA
jgi:hypothetical protein